MSWNLGVDVLGWCGAVLVLVAYALVSTRRVQGDSLPYQSLNVAGSLLLLGNTAYEGAYPSSCVNAVWIAIALYSLLGGGKSRRPR